MITFHTKLARNTDGPSGKAEPPDAAHRIVIRRLAIILAQTLALIPSLATSDPQYDQERCDDLRGKFVNSDSRMAESGGSLHHVTAYLNMGHRCQDDRLSRRLLNIQNEKHERPRGIDRRRFDQHCRNTHVGGIHSSTLADE